MLGGENTPTGPTLALVGATGRFARAVTQVLAMRADCWGEVRLLSDRPSATTLTVRGREQNVQTLTPAAFAGVDVALFNLDEHASRHWAPIAVAAGAVVIDASSGHRYADDVPLVVPEVNAPAIKNRPRGIVAIPGPVGLTLIDAAFTLHQGWDLAGLVVTALVAAASPGQRGVDRLRLETTALVEDPTIGQQAGDVRAALADLPDDSPFPAPLAFNVIPWVGEPREGGWTSLEDKLAIETRKVLDLPDLSMAVTCVQVPVTSTHSLSVHATFRRRVKVDQAQAAIIQAPAMVLLNDAQGREFPTPVDAVGVDPRFVGRVRQASDQANTLDLFICADSLRRGANALVQTAELLFTEGDSAV